MQLYSHPVTVLSVMLVVVADANVGAAGAVCVCLVIGPTFPEVTLLLQLAAVTVTDILYVTSAATVV